MENIIGQMILNFLAYLYLLDASLAKQLAISLNSETAELTQWAISVITQNSFNDAFNILYEAFIDEGFSSE